MSCDIILQAQFQAKQLAQKENKLIQLLEQQHDEAIINRNNNNHNRTFGYNGHMSPDNIPNSAYEFSRQSRTEQRIQHYPNEARRPSVGSFTGRDKSYLLKPVSTPGGGTAIYNKVNKYGGNYGPKRSMSQGRGMSLDRLQYNSPVKHQYESGYSSGTATSISRTRSQHQLSNSSGEDSFTSSSRPSSRGGYKKVGKVTNGIGINHNRRPTDGKGY